MALGELARTWEALARHDAMWAILSDPNKVGNKWDLQEFLQTGRGEAQRTIDCLDAIARPYRCGRALDFGCGLGRVSQGLATFFEQIDGVDISGEMVERAMACNTMGSRVRFHVHRAERLPFDDGTFDFVYCALVLQHVPNALIPSYVREFVRVLAPGGVAMFQAPARCLVAEGDHFASPVDTGDGRVNIDMNVCPYEVVTATITAAGGTLIEALSDGRAGPAFESFTYYARKGDPRPER
jgi:ubiquinone/menaquinone biosynthesis C-methylase UbiE